MAGVAYVGVSQCLYKLLYNPESPCRPSIHAPLGRDWRLYGTCGTRREGLSPSPWHCQVWRCQHKLLTWAVNVSDQGCWDCSKALRNGPPSVSAGFQCVRPDVLTSSLFPVSEGYP